MGWKERLVTARWRGMAFLTESHEAALGRRFAVHEFPGAELPAVEDLGGKAGTFKLNAYFIGYDYDIDRDLFLELLNEPGGDWLTHPWLGQVYVRAQDWSVSETNERGGSCTISVTYVPDGDIPEADPDPDGAALASCQDLAEAALEDFALLPLSAMALSGYIAVIQNRLEVLRQRVSLAALPLTWASQINNVIQGVKTDIAAIAHLHASYAQAFLGIAHSLGLGSLDTGDSGTRTLTAALRLEVVARIAGAARLVPEPISLTGSNAHDVSLAANLRAESLLEHRLIISAALSLAVGAYPHASARDQAVEIVGRSVLRLLNETPDMVFQPLLTARTAVMAALAQQDFGPTVTRNIVRPLPACVIAHGLGIDEDLFLARNKVRHPLFVNGVVYG